MAADLFETYAVTIVATMVLSSIFFPTDYNLMIYPLAIGGACILTSIVGTWFVKLGKSKNIMGALYKGFIVTALTSLSLQVCLDSIYQQGSQKEPFQQRLLEQQANMQKHIL